MSKIASVILDQQINKTLDYEVPEKFRGKVHPGMRVQVPVKNKLQFATVLYLKSFSSFGKLKLIEKVLSDKTSLTDDLFSLAKWMTNYYGTSFQQVLKTMLPMKVRKDQKESTQKVLSLKCSLSKAKDFITKARIKSPQQAKVLEWFLQNEKKGFSSEISKDLKISQSPIKTLIQQGFLIESEEVKKIDDFLQDQEYLPTPFKKLTEEQKICYDQILPSILNQIFQVHLIHGVTGSGKTEIYLHCIREVLKLGKSVIILIPEIALTLQTIERFKTRFNSPFAIFHHQRTFPQKLHDWKLLHERKIPIVIGARSAIFSPAKDIGLIIVDEEHESTYKQSESTPFYHARDVAIVRAKMVNCPILLASATPSIESLHNAKKGKYQLHTLKSRAEKQQLANVKIVDMQTEYNVAGGFTHFSRSLIERIKDRMEKGEQVLLFLNRRGYRTSIVCQKCHQPIKCPHCDLSLAYHKSKNLLQCHLCHYQRPYTLHCPQCNANETFEFKGFGTEHVEKSLKKLFPDRSILRIDRDTTRKKTFLETSLKEFRSGKADILIGTQMVAKGHHFPQVTLVGILNADAGLFLPDFRSQEHTFQKIVQVAGRSGRSLLAGEVILQTFMPNNPIIQMAAKQDYDRFVEKELIERKTFGYPPFCHLVKCVFVGMDENLVKQTALQFQKNCKSISHIEILPLHPCGYPKLKDKFRYQFLIRTKSNISIAWKLLKVKQLFKTKIHIHIDIDPQNTFF